MTTTLRQPLLLGTLAAGNIAVALLYQWYVMVAIGPGMATDALFAGMTVPQLILTVVSASLTQVLVPLLAGQREEAFSRHIWGIFAIVGLSFAALAILLSVSAPTWVPLTVPGFSEEGRRLTVHLARIQLFGMIFTALTGVQSAVYYAKRRFVWVEMVALITSGAGLIGLFFTLPLYGIDAAAWIVALRTAAQGVLQLRGMGPWIKPEIKGPLLRETWRRIKPLLLGNAYYKTDALIDRLLLSMSHSGTLSLYYFGQQIYGAGTGVLTRAIVAPLVPRLAILHRSRNTAPFRHTYRRALYEIGVVTLGCLIAFFLFGDSLLSLLVGYRAGKDIDIEALWLIMVGLSGMFVAGAMGSVTASSFYAQGNTRLATRLGALSYSVYVPVKILSFYFGGAVALAVSASAYYLINLALQFWYLERS